MRNGPDQLRDDDTDVASDGCVLGVLVDELMLTNAQDVGQLEGGNGQAKPSECVDICS